MKSHIYICVLIAVSLRCFSQVPQVYPKEGEIFTIVEQMPEFPGGPEGLFRYLAKTITYPESARVRGMEGTVYLSFVVLGSGQVHDVKVIKGVYSPLDMEAIRVVENMPLWKPGKQLNVAVPVKYQLPVKFKQTHGPVLKSLDEVDVLPEYPGGENALKKHIHKNLQLTKKKELDGYTIIEFVVDSTGATKDHSIFQTFDVEYDQKAVEAIKLLGPWKPGIKNGTPVEVKYRLTIFFRR